MIFPISQELKCILWLGNCMMTLYAADYTLLNIQKTMISSMADDYPGFNMEGYTLTAILYVMITISLFIIGPYITYAIGPRLTLFLSSAGVAFFIATYLSEIPWVIYLGTVVSGIAQGLVWPAEGYYLIHNSSPETIGRNSSIFWSLFSLAELIGNVFVYFVFRGKMYINQSTRHLAIYCLFALNVVSVIEFALLPKPTTAYTAVEYGPLKSIGKNWKVLVSPRMMWLTPTILYTGLQQTFWMGVYSASLGFTLAFGDAAKEMEGLNGIFLGIGGFAGSIVPLLLSGWIARRRFARSLVIMVGCLGGLFTFLAAFLNLPNDAVFNNTFKESVVRPPSQVLALVGSFTLMFGDSCLNTQVYSCLGDYYRERSSEACAIYKIIKNVAIAVFYFVCSYLGLYTQLIVMAVMAVVGSISFFIADRDNQPKMKTNNCTSVSTLQRMSKELFEFTTYVKTDELSVQRF